MVVAVPSFWMCGSKLDLAVISAQCRNVGAALVVDGTQSIGATDFDVNALKPDFLIAAGYKWLLCPYGISFLWAANEYCEQLGAHSQLEIHGWDSRETGRSKANWGLPGGEDSSGWLDTSG